MNNPTLRARVRRHLDRIYPDLGDGELESLAASILAATGIDEARMADVQSQLPGSDEVVLITYGDTFIEQSQPHLRSLQAVWNSHFASVFSTVHVLPFFPSSSDGGFAVVDYRSIDPALGDWPDLTALAGDGGLMVDLVCNHGSAQSDWFNQFLEDRAPGRDYYSTADPDADLSMVTRPRTHPLLRPLQPLRGSVTSGLPLAMTRSTSTSRTLMCSSNSARSWVSIFRRVPHESDSMRSRICGKRSVPVVSIYPRRIRWSN